MAAFGPGGVSPEACESLGVSDSCGFRGGLQAAAAGFMHLHALHVAGQEAGHDLEPPLGDAARLGERQSVQDRLARVRGVRLDHPCRRARAR